MDTNGEPDEEVHTVRSERVPSTRIYIPLEKGCATLLACGCVHQVQSSLNPVIYGILGRFHYTSKID